MDFQICLKEFPIYVLLKVITPDISTNIERFISKTVKNAIIILYSFYFCSAPNVTNAEPGCNFDNGVCGYRQETQPKDKYNWIRRSGSTPSNHTGPTSGPTCQRQ